MKKLLLLFAAAIFISSCSKEEDSYSKSDLLGTWEIQSETFSDSDKQRPLDDCDLKNKLLFVAEDLIITSAYTDEEECVVYDYDLDYSIEGTSIFIDNSDEFGFRTYAEILDKNTIQLEETYAGDFKTIGIYKRR